MLGGLMHRGEVTDPVICPRPDTAMGTRRLRIVDADHAVQPQASFDGSMLVSFNGEIYNHAELRRELEATGIRFKTESDTEVLASALRVWGAMALRRLIGMFAFVAIDIRSGQFLAARDPLGIKPLYFIQSETGFLFCSEIKPLLNATETGNVMFLAPGCMLSLGINSPYRSSLQTFPQPNPHGDRQQLDTLLKGAVHSRLPPDLPVASMFSGGIDSTLVTHYARMVRPEIPGYFLGDASAPDYEYAARYAEATKLDLRCVPFDPGSASITELMDDVVGTVETFEPVSIHSSICSYVLSRQIHQDGFKVALCGEGADELFCGYLPLEYSFAEGMEYGNPLRIQCLSQMGEGNLRRVDRNSMRWQLEARVPFLDPSLIIYACGLEASTLVHKIDGLPRGKMPLRELYDLYPELPGIVKNRTKVPFNEGAGFDTAKIGNPWEAIAAETVSDADMADGLKLYSPFSLRSKEELMYIKILSKSMDVFRVPHLKMRRDISLPNIKMMDVLLGYS
jgi:asparagine synthase (glutamine-hydrolysing)